MQKKNKKFITSICSEGIIQNIKLGRKYQDVKELDTVMVEVEKKIHRLFEYLSKTFNKKQIIGKVSWKIGAGLMFGINHDVLFATVKKRVINEKMTIYAVLLNELVITIEDTAHRLKVNDKKMVMYLIDYIKIRIKLITNKAEMIDQIVDFQRTFLVMDEIESYYFSDLPTNVVGFIIKKVSEQMVIREIGECYGLSIIEDATIYLDDMCYEINGAEKYISSVTKILDGDELVFDKESERKTLINVYEKRDFIIANQNPNGFIFPLDFIYSTSLYCPTYEELCEKFTEIDNQINCGVDLYVGLPDIRLERPMFQNNTIYSDISLCYKYETQYTDLLKAISKSFQNRTINIFIPMIRMNSDLQYWRDFIEVVFASQNNSDFKIGVVFETDSAIEFYNEFENYDFAIIDTDDMIEELSFDYNRYDVVTLREFLFELRIDLTYLHQHLRKRQINHIIMGRHLETTVIFDKMLKMGFKNLGISKHWTKEANLILNDYNSRRGTYQGVYRKNLKRKEKKERANDDISMTDIIKR